MRDDLTIERVTLLNLLGRSDEALDILLSRRFHPWEGGEGKVAAQYTASHVELAKRALLAADYATAIQHLGETLTYPLNLGEGKLANAHDNQIYYLLGEAYRRSGDAERANAAFEKATLGSLAPTSPMYYNDQPPEMIFYQGMARQALGRSRRSERDLRVADRLRARSHGRRGEDGLLRRVAAGLPRLRHRLERTQPAPLPFHDRLGLLGAGKLAEAQDEFDTVLAQQPDHLGAVVHRAWRTNSDSHTSSSVHA